MITLAFFFIFSFFIFKNRFTRFGNSPTAQELIDVIIACHYSHGFCSDAEASAAWNQTEPNIATLEFDGEPLHHHITATNDDDVDNN